MLGKHVIARPFLSYNKNSLTAGCLDHVMRRNQHYGEKCEQDARTDIGERQKLIEGKRKIHCVLSHQERTIEEF